MNLVGGIIIAVGVPLGVVSFSIYRRETVMALAPLLSVAFFWEKLSGLLVEGFFVLSVVGAFGLASFSHTISGGREGEFWVYLLSSTAVALFSPEIALVLLSIASLAYLQKAYRIGLEAGEKIAFLSLLTGVAPVIGAVAFFNPAILGATPLVLGVPAHFLRMRLVAGGEEYPASIGAGGSIVSVWVIISMYSSPPFLIEARGENLGGFFAVGRNRVIRLFDKPEAIWNHLEVIEAIGGD